MFTHLLVAAALAAGLLPAQTAPAPVRNLQVLFLGDRGHHRPAARAALVLAPFRAAGIDLHYSDRLDDLNAETLARYDALLVYANWPALGRAREKAVLDFVAGGKGLVPVHCASACFADSPAWTALVGARFKSHETGEFAPRVTAPEHPVMKGLVPYRTWDETYVHDRHATDREVLAVRDDEPWTWVREHGRGRVFYTASGHDERAWGDAGFQQLLVRGIRFACGDADPGRAGPKAPFAYRDSNAPVPAYQAGKPWGTHTTSSRMQEPLEPRASLARHVVPPELEVELFASEPQIKKPICMAFDARGRCWIAETVDYPNDRGPAGGGHDRIVICDDTDGDGAADAFTVFAEGLSIPSGIAFCRDGVVVAQAPDVLLLRDTDGDGRADRREVLFTGFGTSDSHAGPSNLRYGFDGQVWGTVGYAGFSGTVGGEAHRFAQGIWRCRTDGTRLEQLAATSNNTWGLGFSEDGLVFASTANGNPSVFLGVPQRYYESVRAFSPGALPTIAETTAIHPITAGVRQVDFHGSHTASAGHALYTARRLPREYWNRAAFVAEPTGHLVARLWLERQGSGFVARDGFNLLASDDEWCAPIQAEVGPDGAVWVIDWCNYIVQHNPTPQGFRTGKGNAYETPLRDKTRGRILRLVPRGTPAPQRRDLTRAGDAELVAALRDDNLLWRLHAQRLLVERGAKGQVPAVLELLKAPRVDELGLDAGAVHALWTLRLLGYDGDAFAQALAHPSAAVRRTALAVMRPDAERANALLDDDDALVRLQALLALADAPADAPTGRRLYARLERGSDLDDRWVRDAATAAAARHDAGFLAAALETARAPGSASQTSRPSSAASVAAASRPANLIVNADFAGGEGEAPRGWRVRTYGGNATHAWVPGGRSGSCVRIASETGSDTSYYSVVQVEPGATYRLSGWIKTEGLERGASQGALFNVHELQNPIVRTRAVAGTSDWTEVAVTFESGAHDRLTINCLFGGWGRARGRAWFDDLRLVRTDSQVLPGALGRIVGRVTAHYAGRAPKESIADLLALLPGASPPLAAEFLEGLAAGWPASAAPELGPAQVERIAALARQLPADARARLVALADRWGIKDRFAAALPELVEALSRTVRDPSLAAERRAEAAKRWLAVEDRVETVKAILGAVALDTEPEAAKALVQSLEASASPETGGALLAHWPALAPAARPAASHVLLRRAAWATALLDAVEGGTVPAATLAAEIWLQLLRHPDAAIAQRARAASGRDASGGGAAFERVRAALTTAGDAERGRALFGGACTACHRLGGAGGTIGPALDGIGKRAPAELLLAIVDPNQSVEENFRLWTARTKDGRVISGRLEAETKGTFEIADLAGGKHVLVRGEVVSCEPSPVSLMPVGYEGLGVAGLADLLAFLARSR